MTAADSEPTADLAAQGKLVRRLHLRLRMAARTVISHEFAQALLNDADGCWHCVHDTVSDQAESPQERARVDHVVRAVARLIAQAIVNDVNRGHCEHVAAMPSPFWAGLAESLALVEDDDGTLVSGFTHCAAGPCSAARRPWPKPRPLRP